MENITIMHSIVYQFLEIIHVNSKALEEKSRKRVRTQSKSYISALIVIEGEWFLYPVETVK